MKTATFWSIIFVLVLVVVVTFKHSNSVNKNSILPQSTSAAVNPAVVSGERVPVSAGASSATSNPVVSGRGKVISQAPVLPNSAAPISSGPLQQQGQLSMPVIINAPMSDQEIQKGVESQNQKIQALEKMLDKRDKEAVQVRRAVAAEQMTKQEEQQKMPSDFSQEQPPEDIVLKLKTHQLTAH